MSSAQVVILSGAKDLGILFELKDRSARNHTAQICHWQGCGRRSHNITSDTKRANAAS